MTTIDRIRHIHQSILRLVVELPGRQHNTIDSLFSQWISIRCEGEGPTVYRVTELYVGHKVNCRKGGQGNQR